MTPQLRTILIIEDEPSLAAALVEAVQRLGFDAVSVASGALGLERLSTLDPALVILDIGLPDMSGLDALSKIRDIDEDLAVLIITAHGNLENAVEAKRRGASHYLVKPLDLEEFAGIVEDLVAEAALLDEPEVVTPASEAGAASEPSIVGSSTAMQPAFAAIAHASTADAAVLITGPTGIGKSLAARVIHNHSARRTRPFVTVSCGSLPETLLEAELFGYEKGAFTGAVTMREGHLERAAGGTLFLDEIGDISPAVQVKLLRFLDERTFTRVGGREDLSVDMRVIAATNQDLQEAVRARRFREDLLYRLRILEVHLPPLRERIEDLPALCSHLLRQVAPGRSIALSQGLLEQLGRHDWPGNVRELKNALEHAVAVCSGPVLTAAHLPRDLRALDGAGETSTGGDASRVLESALSDWLDGQLAEDGQDYAALHGELERRLLEALLPRFGGKPTHLARALGMNRATLRRKLRDAESD